MKGLKRLIFLLPILFGNYEINCSEQEQQLVSLLSYSIDKSQLLNVAKDLYVKNYHAFDTLQKLGAVTVDLNDEVRIINEDRMLSILGDSNFRNQIALSMRVNQNNQLYKCDPVSSLFAQSGTEKQYGRVSESESKRNFLRYVDGMQIQNQVKQIYSPSSALASSEIIQSRNTNVSERQIYLATINSRSINWSKIDWEKAFIYSSEHQPNNLLIAIRSNGFKLTEDNALYILTDMSWYKSWQNINNLKKIPGFDEFVLSVDHQLKINKSFEYKMLRQDSDVVKFIQEHAVAVKAFYVRRLNEALDNSKAIFLGKKEACASDITQINGVFEKVRQAVEAGYDIDITQEQFQNIANEAGIDYSVYEFNTQDNQTILVRVLKDENAALKTDGNIKFIGSVYSHANKSISMVYEKNGEYIEIPLNANLLSRFSKTDRNLFFNPNKVDLTQIEVSNINSAVSVILDFIPVVNTIKSTIEVVAGVDYITGQKLTLSERGLAALGTMPVIGWVKKSSKFFKGASKIKCVAKENKIVSLIRRGAFKNPVAAEKVILSSAKQVQNAVKVVAKRYGAVIEKAKTGKGWRMYFTKDKKAFTVRIMDAGSGNKTRPYFRISVDKVGALDARGKPCSDMALTHIDLDTDYLKQFDTIVNNYLLNKGSKL